MSFIVSVVLVFVATLIGAVGALLFKIGSAGRLHPLKAITNIPLIIGVGFYGLSSVLFIIALKGASVAIMYPLTSLTYIWIAFLSMKYLGEKMNSHKWMGILLIIFGVALIGLSN